MGNVRLIYSDTDDDGEIKPEDNEIFDEKNYYPFGGIHEGYNTDVNGTYHPYGYNSKEENNEIGLGTLDFGARNYDPWLGRWMNLDSLAEKMRRHSPYNYTFDNPIFFIDPDGMAPEDIIIRARSKASNGEYVPIAVVRTEIEATVDLDLDVASAPLIDGITGAEKPIEINGQHIDPKADAFGLSVTASVTAGYGEVVVKNVVAFFNGPEKGNAFLYESTTKNIGLEGSLTIGADNYFSNGNVNTFNKNTLEGKEIGIDLSGSLGNAPLSVGASGFAGIDVTSKNPIPYVGYSKTVSGSVGLPIRGYLANSTLITEITENK